MPTYNNLDSLYKALGKQIEGSLSKTATDYVERATELIWDKFYKEYTPKEGGYERTYQLLNSVMKTAVKKQNNTYSVEIYLDPTGVNYADTSALEVFLLASEGYHGNKNIKTDYEFWKMLVDEAMKTWRSYLIKNGLNVI